MSDINRENDQVLEINNEKHGFNNISYRTDSNNNSQIIESMNRDIKDHEETAQDDIGESNKLKGKKNSDNGTKQGQKLNFLENIEETNNTRNSSNNVLNQIKLEGNINQKKRLERGVTTMNDKMRQSMAKKKHLEKKDLYNREQSKLACLIRKKYTALMKESIKLKGTKERYICCASCRKVTTKVIYQLTGTLVQAIISILAIIVYVISTYYPDYSLIDQIEEPDKTVVVILKWTELAIAIIINLDYIYNIITSKQRYKYIFNFLNILDILIVISIYINFIIKNMNSLSFLRVFRVIRIMRVFRFYKIIESRKKESFEENKNEISRRLVSAILTVLAVVFLATGVVHFLNDNFPEYFRIVIPSLDKIGCSSGKNFTLNNMDAYREGMNVTLSCEEGDPIVKIRGTLSFDLAFYYMVITMATVGYGDIYPDTSWMRLVIGIFVIISIITISKQTSELNDLIKLNSEYLVPFKETKGHKHCVLSGFFTKSSLIKFLNEFYHIDHKDDSENTKIVIIQSEYPDKEIQSILLNPKFEENLHYLIGDIFSENTLQMSKVQTASGIFLISDQSHQDSAKNDQFLILACKAISQFSQAPLYVQFNYSQSLLHDWADWDMACSSQQIKMSIIVKNGFISGFSTMIMNLSSSSSSFYNSEIKETPWMLEYIHGASQEIYIVKIPQGFIELNFAKFAERAYIDCGSLIIGVKKKVYYKEDKDIFFYIYLLNPIDYYLQEEDELVIISSDFDAAKAIFSNSKRNKQKTIDENENHKLFDKNHLNFIKFFRDENAGIKENILTMENEDDNDLNNKRSSINYPGVDYQLLTKLKIPDVFHKRQHYKIWEKNPEEFERELNNHYLIFCKEEHLWEFMNCFDMYYSEIIFFVSDQHPSPKWDIVRRYFKNLVFIECSYSDQEDLVKLRLEKAKHVFILTYAVENSNVNDSGILPLVKIIEENFPKCKYTLELSDELNVRYLNNKGMDQEGRNFGDSSSQELHDKEKKKKKNNKKVARLPVRLWPKYAKSDIFFSSSLESLLAFSYHNQGLLDVITKILGIGNTVKDKDVLENDAISMYRYVGINRILYDKVVNNFFMLDPPIIPIAVFRMNTDDKELKNESPYIITNPKKDLELNQFDKVICIGKPNVRIFEIFNEEEFREEESDHTDTVSSESSNSIELIPDKNKKKNITGKIFHNEDLENLDEEQLLERLKNEIKILKTLAKGSQVETHGSSKLNLKELGFPLKLSTLNRIDEKNEENDEGPNPTISDRKSIAESQVTPSNKSGIIFPNIKDEMNKNTRSIINKLEEKNVVNIYKNTNEEIDSSKEESINNLSNSPKKNKTSESDQFSSISNSSDDQNNKSIVIKTKKSRKEGKQIINNNNFNIKISSNNQFQGNNLINFNQPKVFNKLTIAAVECFDITKNDK